MHYINRSFLKLALLPAKLYGRMGVDTDQLKIILSTKLILDDRRPRPITQTVNTKQNKPTNMATLRTMFMSVVMGLVFLVSFFIGSDMQTHLTAYFTFFFILLSLTLITDFTSVLIDVRDNYILLPKPVSDKTIVVARLLHIFIHLCKILVPMSLPGVIYLGITAGVYGALILLLLTFLLAAFSIFFINAVYIAILRFTTPQRFQSIITYVQIIFAIVLYGGYQLFPRFMARNLGDDFTVTTIKGIVFFPLYWLASSWQLAFTFSGSYLTVALGIIGFLFPLLCIWAVVSYLAPSFNRKVAMLSANENSSQPKSTIRGRDEKSLSGLLGRLVTSGTIEKASFAFAWKMMRRSRDFKLKVYPNIGYIVVFIVVILLRNDDFSLADLDEDSSNLPFILLSAIYLSVFLLSMAASQIVYSDKYKASWIFYTSPIAKPGLVLAGALKAILLTFLLPVAAAVGITAVFFAGPTILPNFLLGVSNVILITLLMTYSGKQLLPFSTSQSTNAKAGSLLTSVFVLLLCGVVVLGHFFIYSLLPVVLIFTVLSLLAVWLLFDSLKKISWEKVISNYAAE